jgi:hypothetical protein
MEGEMMMAVSSSDGTGITVPVTATNGNSYSLVEPAHFGTGWGGASGNPFTALRQQRSLVIAADGMSAYVQDMGSDTILELSGTGEVEPASSDAIVPATFVKAGLGMVASLVYLRRWCILCFRCSIIVRGVGFR